MSAATHTATAHTATACTNACTNSDVVVRTDETGVARRTRDPHEEKSYEYAGLTVSALETEGWSMPAGP
jgi:hypothetical protein